MVVVGLKQEVEADDVAAFGVESARVEREVEAFEILYEVETTQVRRGITRANANPRRPMEKQIPKKLQ